MIKQIGPKASLQSTEDTVMALRDMPGLVFACVEPDGDEFRCVSYWEVEGKASKTQRDIPCFYATGYSKADG